MDENSVHDTQEVEDLPVLPKKSIRMRRLEMMS